MSSSKLSLNHVPAIVPSCWGYSNRLSRETFFSHRPLFTYPSKSRRIMSYNSYTFTNYHFKMASVRNEERPNLGGPWCLTKPREQTTGYQAELQDSSSKMSGTRRRRPMQMAMTRIPGQLPCWGSSPQPQVATTSSPISRHPGNLCGKAKTAKEYMRGQITTPSPRTV